MAEPYYEIVLPQLGVNDEEATIVEWLVARGGRVSYGQPIAIVETGKASVELDSEESGYLYPLVEPGQRVPICEVIALILPAPDEEALQEYLDSIEEDDEADPEEPRMTYHAQRLAREYHVDSRRLAADHLVDEHDVLALVKSDNGASFLPDPLRRVAIYGATPGGRALMECIQAMGGYEVVAFLDNAPERLGSEYYGLPVWNGADMGQLRAHNVRCVATHLMNARERFAIRDRAAAAGLVSLNVVHPSAFVAPSVRMGAGNLIKAAAVLDTDVQLGDCCIVENGVIASHHSRIGSGCHLAPGAVLGGECQLGEGCVIGVGAQIAPRIVVGRNVIVSPGGSVVRDIPDNAVVDGQPARVIGERLNEGP